MAKFNVEFPDDLQQMLEKVGSNSEISKKAVAKGLPILKASVMRELSGHKNKGDLISSIETTKVEKNKDGYFGVVKPSGTDRKGIRNGEKLAYLEFGAYGHNQSATPVLAPACTKSKEKIYKAFQEVFDEVLK